MSDCEEEFEVVDELTQSQLQLGESNNLQSWGSKKLVHNVNKHTTSASYNGPEKTPETARVDKKTFSSVPELGLHANSGPPKLNNSTDFAKKMYVHTKAASIDDSLVEIPEEITSGGVERLRDRSRENSMLLRASSFVQGSFLPHPTPKESTNTQYLKQMVDDQAEIKNWAELTESEVGYKRCKQEEAGSHFRLFLNSHLSKPVPDPAATITLVVIGDLVNSDDKNIVGGMLARSVNRTAITDSSSKIGDRPPLRLFNLTETSFSNVLLHFGMMQAERDKGLLVPPTDICVCLFSTEKIMRHKLDFLKTISESVNLLPLLTQPSDSPEKIEPICKKILGERLAEAGVIYYTLSPKNGRLIIGVTSEGPEPTSVPCATVSDFATCPIFQLVMAWPAIRKSAHDRQNSNPVHYSNSFGIHGFVAVIIGIIAIVVCFCQYDFLTGVNADSHHGKDYVPFQIHEIQAGDSSFEPHLESSPEPSSEPYSDLHSDDIAFQKDFKPV